MAKKQTRRSVSMRRLNYEAVQQAATARGMTLAGLVEFALGASGVSLVTHPQQSPELVGAIAVRSGKRTLSTRRSVSINRHNYEAARQVAASRGMSIAGFVEAALGAVAATTP